MFNDLLRSLLKPGYRLDLSNTRNEYNEVASLLFVGVGFIGITSLFLLPHFEFKNILIFYISYCFVMPVITQFWKPGYPLWLSVLQVPIGFSLIVSLQWFFPIDLVYFTSFLYPLVFIFTFHFHTRHFSIVAMLVVSLVTAGIIYDRQLPHWPLYFLTTFGSTLLIGMVVDRAVSRTLRLANYDSLTGLMNRHYWEATVNHLIAIAHRERKPLSVIFFDLDNFKIINDKEGHKAGDEVLRLVAKNLKEISREADCQGRWGGDEFALALPNTNQEQARALLHRLESSIYQVEISPGIASLSENESLESLLDRADTEMYQVKNSKDNKQHNLF